MIGLAATAFDHCKEKTLLCFNFYCFNIITQSSSYNNHQSMLVVTSYENLSFKIQHIFATSNSEYCLLSVAAVIEGVGELLMFCSQMLEADSGLAKHTFFG